MSRSDTHPSFNPRPPCGERPSETYTDDLVIFVSIHAPRAGSDPIQAT
ncbi:Uncharacterized protein dnm_098590 [Desulfonema magnum]|uniref:Uncharacterized protein n=1 Tax=Desulfonema magnum TaxID=45655 RepID=A0A975BXT2_9BACT|nr:Uncharacterized protein dnm_098590 [Desulfonema magnum]